MSNKWLATAAMAVGMAAVPSLASADVNWRVFAGVSDVEDIEQPYYGYSIDISADSGFVIGAAAGVDVGNWLFEAELAHRSADLNEASLFGYGYQIDGELTATSLMANVWYNFPISGNWGAYAGGGIGIAKAEVEMDLFGYSYSDDSTEAAWQLGAGVNLKTDAGFAYGIGYRYFNLPDVNEADISAHEIVFEVRF